jgi:hypothetical protein
MNPKPDPLKKFMRQNRPTPSESRTEQVDAIWAKIQDGNRGLPMGSRFAMPIWMRLAPIAAVLVLILVARPEATRLQPFVSETIETSDGSDFGFLDEEGLDEIYLYSAALLEEPAR